MTYDCCKMVIEKGLYDKADMLEKLELFRQKELLTQEQHDELLALMD